MPKHKLTAEQRFSTRFTQGSKDQCWPWTGGRSDAGYGIFWHKGRQQGAHRFSWETANGPIPPGLNVLHRCDNPPCVNPCHLFLGTHADNMADKACKGRSIRGERHKGAKLTASIVQAIRASKEPQIILAERYGVHQGTISRIKLRGSWKHA